MSKLNLLSGAAAPAMPQMQQAAYSIDTFCAVHDISRASLYNAWAEGTGPAFFRVGSKRLISREAAARWREEREQAAIAAA
jgi:hypothetical protein